MARWLVLLATLLAAVWAVPVDVAEPLELAQLGTHIDSWFKSNPVNIAKAAIQSVVVIKKTPPPPPASAAIQKAAMEPSADGSPFAKPADQVKGPSGAAEEMALEQSVPATKTEANLLSLISAAPTKQKTLLVAVCSAPWHFEEREAIRRTWAKLAQSTSLTYDVLFFVGQLSTAMPNRVELEERLVKEAKVRGDMVYTDSFVEAYTNLTRKTLAMIDFAAKKNYEVMLKVDDDSFVLLDNFFYDVLLYEPERPLLYWGKFWGSDDRPVNRVKGSKFYTSETEYSPSTYPNYADGPCYALGKDLLKYISSRASSLPLYSMEDAAVGIWLNSAPLPVKAIYGDGYMYRRECPPGNGYYFVNPVIPSEMDVIFDKYKRHEDICDNGYALAVCASKDRGCLCSPTENPCWDKQI